MAMPRKAGTELIRQLRFCWDIGNSATVICRSHSFSENFWRSPFAEHVDPKWYEPEVVLQGIHDACFGSIHKGHFTTSRDVRYVFSFAGSLFTIKPGTRPTLDAPYAVIDTDALDMEEIRSATEAEDVFEDFPFPYMMHSGYTFWTIPPDVFEWTAYQTVVQPRENLYGGPGEHFCKDRVVLNRVKYINYASDSLSREDAEKAADEAAMKFKVAVELDFSALGISNMVLFLRPEDAKNPEKVVEEMSNPLLVGGVNRPAVDMSEMRLVPHPDFNDCDTTNWFKVVPKGRKVSWEAEGYQRCLSRNKRWYIPVDGDFD